MQLTPGFAGLVAPGSVSAALPAAWAWRKTLRPTAAPLAVRPT